MTTPRYVFGIGFQKTGTSSLSAALNLLNIPSLHYYFVHNDKKFELSSLIRKNQSSSKNLFYLLDSKYQSFIDFEGEEYYKTLYTQYPNSAFIFTHRPFLPWFKSYVTMSQRWRDQQLMTSEELSKCHIQIVEKYFHKTEEIREFFRDKPPNRYLEIEICSGEGWEKLCDFLNLPVPAVPFPHKNKTKKHLV
jgi:hypothetical protein